MAQGASMRKAVSILSLVSLALIGVGGAQTTRTAPRLLVIVVLDQFRAEYLKTFASHWRAGFKTLLTEGANFRHAQYPYLHTDTCAGHTTIGTGTLPHTHGMMGDRWWVRDARKEIL